MGGLRFGFATGALTASFAASSALATACLAFQAYFLWNFSTRPAVSMNYCCPVKNG